MINKKSQLGINPSTAQHRLRVDIIFAFISDSGIKCYRCNKEMTRKDFSIDHKNPWIDAKDPVKSFFDLENIAFSHKFCNFSCARKPTKGRITIIHGANSGYDSGCRCELCSKHKSLKNKKRIRKIQREVAYESFS